MIKIKWLCILILAVLYRFESRAQQKGSATINGEVRDTITLEPIAFAHISIKGQSIGVAANREGRFSLHLPNPSLHDSLRISCIGYTSITIPIKEVSNVGIPKFLLTKNTTPLPEVVITAPNAERIIKTVSKRLRETLPSEPYELEGYYRNAYREFNTYVRQFEAAFSGLDLNYHSQNKYSVIMLKKKVSPDYRKFKWRQSQGNIPWHYLGHIRQQQQFFFTDQQYRKYDYTVEDVLYWDDEKVYKLKFILKDKTKRITESWAFIRARDYAILEIGGKTKIVNPKKVPLSDSLLMAYTGSSVLIKYVDYGGRMYPSYGRSLYQHDVYSRLPAKQGSFDLDEEMFIHEIKRLSSYKNKNSFTLAQQKRILNLPSDSVFWQHHNQPPESVLSRTIKRDLSAQQEAANLQLPVLAEANKNLDKPIAVEQLKKDFTLFRTSLQEAHPSLYRYTPKPELDSLFESTYHNLITPLSEIKFFQLLSPILAKIRCGHTRILPSKKYSSSSANKAHFLPFQTKYLQNKLFIVKTKHPADSFAQGAEIVSINGLSLKNIIDRIYSHLPADGYIETSKKEQLSRDFVQLYHQYVAPSGSFAIVIKNNQGLLNTVQTSAISYNQYLSWVNKQESNTYALLHPKMGLLKVGTFTDIDNQPFKNWLEEVFEDISNKKVKNLIIDLRDNGGGRDDYAMYLFSFLASSPFHYHSSLQAATNYYSFLSYTDQEEALNSLMAQIVSKDTKGNFFLRNTHATLKTTPPQALPFTGKVYFLINGNTFSAAADFAALARELKRGEFIGQETGGAYEANSSNGEILLTLPHSGLRIGIPLFQIKNAVSTIHPPGRGVMPDHATTYTIRDVLLNKDKELELADSLISIVEK